MKQFLLAFLMIAAPLAAHEPGEHAKKAVQEAKQAVVESAAAAGDAVKKAGTKAGDAVKAGVAKAEGEVVTQIEPFSAMKEGAGKHLHNKIVHFPIALGFFGAFFLLLSYRYPSYKWPARTLLFFAALGATAAYLTGPAQAGEFEGTSYKEVLGWHQQGAKVVLALLWGALVLSFFDVTRKFFWLYAIVLAWFLLTSAALGGILASA
jgi:uncharacterized membrane protein